MLNKIHWKDLLIICLYIILALYIVRDILG
jgi:hypothetical protein